MAVTLHDVAKLAGVSIKTVSKVIHNQTSVRDETRERVREAIAELGYRPNLTARSLRSGRTDIIGLAVPQLNLTYFADLADTIIESAARRGLDVLIEQTGGSRDREIQALHNVRQSHIDGLILSPSGLRHDDYDVVDVDTPLVLLGERIIDGPTDHVTMHNILGGQAATRHLLDIGRRRIAVIGARPNEDIGAWNFRIEGYRNAHREVGVPVDERMIFPAAAWYRSEGANATRDLIASGLEFDAIFALSDSLGVGAIRVLLESGYRIPDDVAVIGFDDLDESRYCYPSLSTVNSGRLEIAETAVSLLVDRIAHPEGGRKPQTVKAAFEVIQRESTTVPQQPSAS